MDNRVSVTNLLLCGGGCLCPFGQSRLAGNKAGDSELGPGVPDAAAPFRQRGSGRPARGGI
jgi:hypothetical protein